MKINVISSGSHGNCYHVTDGRTPMLIECGVTRNRVNAYLRQHGLDRPRFCLISHEHKDHCRAFRELEALGVPCYCSPGTAEVLGKPRHAPDTGTWVVSTFPVEHDAAQPVGFLLESGDERLLYATDTQYLDVQFGGVTHIMLEANYSMEIIKANVASGQVERDVKHRVIWNHQSLQTAMKYLERMDRSCLQEVYLLHLSDANADEEAFCREARALVGVPVYIA